MLKPLCNSMSAYASFTQQPASNLHQTTQPKIQERDSVIHAERLHDVEQRSPLLGYLSHYPDAERDLAWLLDRVAESEVAATLEPLFALFAAERTPGEGFGDFCHRAGTGRLLAALGAQLQEVS